MNAIRICVFVLGFVSNVISTIDDNFCERSDSIDGSSSEFCQTTKAVHKTQGKWLYPRKWISELLSEAKDEFRMDSMTNDECKRDFNVYRLYLQNQSIWAIQSKLICILRILKDGGEALIVDFIDVPNSYLTTDLSSSVNRLTRNSTVPFLSTAY